MIPFKGTVLLEAVHAHKPVRGIKVWARAEAFNGYVSAFQVYTGKRGDNIQQGLGAKVVKGLTGDLNGSLTTQTKRNAYPRVILS